MNSDEQLKNRKTRAISYFSKPGFERLLHEIWKRYAGLGRVGGNASIERAMPEECEAINEFMGWREKPGATIKVPLLQFEHELRGSVFACTIMELHTWLSGEPLHTKSEMKMQSEQAWQHFFTEIEHEWLKKADMDIAATWRAYSSAVTANNRMVERLGAGDGKGGSAHLPPIVQQWLSELQNGSIEAGYRMIRELWQQSPEQAASELLIALRALQVLIFAIEKNEPPVRLPVLAAHVSGNPHALDRTSSAGRLLFQALRFTVDYSEPPGRSALQKEPVPGKQILDRDVVSDDVDCGSEQQDRAAVDSLSAREIYRKIGVLDDDLSSLVHLFQPNDHLKNEPYVMTLRQVEATDEWIAVSDIYVVENPAVFATLVDCSLTMKREKLSVNLSLGHDNRIFSTKQPLLVCTSGPASAAALRLFDRYMQHHDWCGKLYYSGDFDVKGIEIGNVLAARYSHAFVPWRFDRNSYEAGLAEFYRTRGIKGVSFTAEERQRLATIQVKWDASLTTSLLESGVKLFQEQLITRLIADWTE